MHPLTLVERKLGGEEGQAFLTIHHHHDQAEGVTKVPAPCTEEGINQ